MSSHNVTPRDIWVARRELEPLIRKTPLVVSPSLSERVGASVYLKLENLQETGSFKIRGAANRLLHLTDEEKARGVVTFSTGNHGRAVAHVARELGVRAVVCLSKRVPAYRIEAIRRLGAELAVVGECQDEAEEYANQLREQQGMTMINPFDDPFVIAGQGTIGLELLADLPEIGTVVVPVSGGGLIAGIALILKAADPSIRVIGVSMERAPVMFHSLRAGRPIHIEEEETLADALAGGIGLDNQYTFGLVQRLVDEMTIVSEADIAAAIAFALEEHGMIVEGAGAVGIGALRFGKAQHLAKNVAIVVSGGNLDPGTLLRVVRELDGETRE